MPSNTTEYTLYFDVDSSRGVMLALMTNLTLTLTSHATPLTLNT
jgi:hypothetical protein